MRVTFDSHVSSKCLCLTFDPERQGLTHGTCTGTDGVFLLGGGGVQMLGIATVPVGLTVVRNACSIMF